MEVHLAASPAHPLAGGEAPADDDGPAQQPRRLPSISALLNAASPASRDKQPPAPSVSLPGCNSFDAPPQHGALSASISPISPTSQPASASPEFPPVATAAPDTAEEAGVAQSLRVKATENPPAPPRQLTSVEFPDGNALRPLPSGLSSATNTNGRDDSLRPRSNSISYSAPDPPSFGRLSHSGFATSSERGGGGPDDRARPPSFFPSHDYTMQYPNGLGSSPGRPRALSISTTDEYRLHSSWPGSRVSPIDPATGHPFRSSVDLSSLRRGSGPPRLAYVAEQPLGAAPSGQPPPGWNPHLPPSHAAGLPQPYHPSAGLVPLGPTSAHPSQPMLGLVPLAIPSGLPGSSPVSPPSANGATLVSPLDGRRPSFPVAPPAGWGALPGRPGPPPSGQIAASLAQGVDLAQEAQNEVGRYGCPHCAKRFARPSSLRIHMHSHTGEKPFTCPLCDRAFSVQSNLRRHLKIHKGGAVQVGPSRRGGPSSISSLAKAQAMAAETAGGEEGMEVDAEEGENDGDGDGEGRGPSEEEQ
ncbi:hypothetical protein JCM10207_006742 [Rhodosporidiobolus poonsookiae]